MPKTRTAPTLAEAWERVSRLVFSTAAKFHRRYGGDPYEAAADATYYFVRAYLKWPAGGLALTTWVRRFVWRELFEDYRKELHRRAVIGRRVDGETVGLADNDLLLAQMASLLPADAGELLRELAFDPVGGLRAAEARMARRGWGRARTRRAADDLRGSV